MKTLVAVFSGLMTVPSFAAIIAGYDFNSGTNTVSSSDSSVTADAFIPHGSINNVSRPVIYPNANGNGWIAAPTSEVVGSSNPVGTETLAYQGSDYFSFKVTPTTGFALNLTQLSFGTAFHSTGTFTLSGSYFVRSSVDNYATTIGGNIFDESHVNSTDPTFTERLVDLSGAGYQNLTSEVTFRIYLYDNSNSTTRWLAVDNVELEGTVTPVPEPSALAMILPLLPFLSRRRR